MDRIIKAKRKKRQPRNYFTRDTDRMIMLYNNLEDPGEKNMIYEKHLHYPFFKLTQNIIHTFKFYNTDVPNLEHLQHEIIIFLLSKIHLYDHKNNIQKRLEKLSAEKFNEIYEGDFVAAYEGQDEIFQEDINNFIDEQDLSSECRDFLKKKITPPKGYSYFGTIVKRWCISYDKKNYDKKINSTSLDYLSDNNDNESYINFTNSILKDEEQETRNNIEIEYDNSMTTEDKDDPLSYFMDNFIEYCYDNLYELFPKKNDAQIADAVLVIFKKRENLQAFNKKALYWNIREIVDVKTPKLTKICKDLKLVFDERYQFFLSEGYIPE